MSYHSTVQALRARLDPGSKLLAAQDFRHAIQNDTEPVVDIRWLEHQFQLAYRRDNLCTETREAIIYGQLQEGLCFKLIKGPAVSGAQNYKELCVAAKSEDKRIAELERRQQHLKGSDPQPPIGEERWKSAHLPRRGGPEKSAATPTQEPTRQGGPQSTTHTSMTCYGCGSPPTSSVTVQQLSRRALHCLVRTMVRAWAGQGTL